MSLLSPRPDTGKRRERVFLVLAGTFLCAMTLTQRDRHHPVRAAGANGAGCGRAALSPDIPLHRPDLRAVRQSQGELSGERRPGPQFSDPRRFTAGQQPCRPCPPRACHPGKSCS